MVGACWRATARALAVVRGLRLYQYTGQLAEAGFLLGTHDGDDQ